MNDKIDQKYFKIKLRQKDQASAKTDAQNDLQNTQPKQKSRNTTNIQLSSIFQNTKQDMNVSENDRMFAEEGLSIGFGNDPEDKQEFQMAQQEVDLEKQRQLYTIKASNYTDMPQQESIEQQSIYFDNAGFEQRNPLESLLESSASQMLEKPEARGNVGMKFSKKNDATLDLGQGLGIVAMANGAQRGPHRKDGGASKPSQLQARKVRPQIPQLKSQIKQKPISQTIQGSNQQHPPIISARQTKELVLDVLRPQYGVWTLDQQLKANEISKTYIKNMKLQLKQGMQSKAQSLQTIDLNILNLAQQEVERKQTNPKPKTQRTKLKTISSLNQDVQSQGKMQTVDVTNVKQIKLQSEAQDNLNKIEEVDSLSGGSSQLQDDQAKAQQVTKEIDVMNHQIAKQRDWIKKFVKDKANKKQQHDTAYETLEVEKKPQAIETLNLKSIDTSDVASIRTLSFNTEDKQEDAKQSQSMKHLNYLLLTSSNLQYKIDEMVESFEKQKQNRRLQTNLDSDFVNWDPEFKQYIFNKKTKQLEEQELILLRKQKRKEEGPQQKKKDQDMLEIDLDEVITGQMKIKKRPKKQGNINDFV